MAEPQRGRPRSEAKRVAILEATRDLVVELGYEEMTVEAIATRAGTGKQTIYRWWPAKSYIVADAVTGGYLRLPSGEVPNTGSLEDDLKSWVAGISEMVDDDRAMSVVRALVNASTDNALEASHLYEQLTSPNHRALTERVTMGQDAGQLARGIDPQAVTDALVGAVLFGILSRAPSALRLAAVVDALLHIPKEQS